MSRLRQNFCSCLLSSFSSFFQLSFNNQHGTVIFICLPMKHLGVLKNSRPSRSIWNLELLVFEEREKSEYPEKNFSDNKVENSINPHMVSQLGLRPGPHWWGASALTTAPLLVPSVILR